MSLLDPNANANVATTNATETAAFLTMFDRIGAALEAVGVTPYEINEIIAKRMEAAAVAFGEAKVPADKDFFHGEVIRLAAALHAIL